MPISNLALRSCRLLSPTFALQLRQISMDAKSAASKLSSSGLLRTRGLIGGKWTGSYDGKSFEVRNPATGDVIANVPCMGAKETNDAISSANDAFASWSKLTANERSKCLRKWYDLLMARKEDLALMITLEQGKPLKEAMGEVVYGAGFIEFSAEEAKRIYGDIIPAPLSDRRILVLKQPVGVVGAITPWNFPLAMITRKVGYALASGCTVVIKPSELTPLTALAAAELALQAGIPPGVINVVMGDAPSIGDALLASTKVRKITFTGSTAVGKKLMAGSANTVKRVSLELGGNAPCIVFDDADLDVAVKGCLGAKFRNSGQTCVCANRIIVQEGIYEKFAVAFAKAIQNLEVGNGLTDGVALGPLINEAAVQKVEKLIQDATLKGAKVMLGGGRHSLGMTFYQPTVLTDVNNEMLISREEAFGPVAPLLQFKHEDEAIKIANDTNAAFFRASIKPLPPPPPPPKILPPVTPPQYVKPPIKPLPPPPPPPKIPPPVTPPPPKVSAPIVTPPPPVIVTPPPPKVLPPIVTPPPPKVVPPPELPCPALHHHLQRRRRHAP